MKTIRKKTPFGIIAGILFVAVTAYYVLNYFGWSWPVPIGFFNVGTLVLLALGCFLSRAAAGKVLVLLGSAVRAVYPLLNLQHYPDFTVSVPSAVSCAGFLLLAVVAVLSMAKAERKWLVPVSFIPGAVIAVQAVLDYIIYDDMSRLILLLGMTAGVVLGGLALAKPETTVSVPAPAAGQPRSLRPVEELKKYKELLDSGVISQEEYDEKKKQLLGL